MGNTNDSIGCRRFTSCRLEALTSVCLLYSSEVWDKIWRPNQTKRTKWTFVRCVETRLQGKVMLLKEKYYIL